MRKTICLCALVASLTTTHGQKPVRFSLKTATLALTNCLANPGSVAIPLTPDDTNIEIVDWKTVPTDAEHEGEFVLRMAGPTIVGCIIVYGAGAVSYETAGDWKPLQDPREQGRQLQFLVPVAGDLITGIKIVVPAQRLAGSEDSPQFQATLPFLTLIPVRAINIAMNSTVTTSSQGEPALGKPSSNHPRAIIDGLIHPRANFSTAKRPSPITPEFPEWIQLTFEEPQSVRGLVLFRGSEDHGLGQSVTEAYIGNGAPTSGTEGWAVIKGMASQPGKFRSHEFLVSVKNIDAKAIRIRSMGGAQNLALGELAVLTDLGYAPVPAP